MLRTSSPVAGQSSQSSKSRSRRGWAIDWTSGREGEPAGAGRPSGVLPVPPCHAPRQRGGLQLPRRWWSVVGSSRRTPVLAVVESPRGRAAAGRDWRDWGYPQLLSLNFFLYITFSPIFPPIFSSPAAVPPKYSPIPHYNYKISFSISTINFLSTNNYSWTHNTVFRVMNSDTLDLGGERRVPTRRGRRCGRRVPPTAGMQGEGDCKGAALRTAWGVDVTYIFETVWA
jgi:hypothetical protein